MNIWIWPKMKCSSWFFLEKYTGTFQTEAGTSQIWHEEKKWNKIQIICVTSRTEVIWGHEWVCEWLIQDVWRTSSQSLEILIRLKRLSWTVRPIGWLPLHVAFYERPLKIRNVIFIKIETRINNNNGFIFGIWTLPV